MGEPDSNQVELVMQVALSALGPKGEVSASALRETGLHSEMVRHHMAVLGPELKYLVGWKSLSEYDYPTSWYDSTLEDRRRGEERTSWWRETLESEGLSAEKAVLIYDGATEHRMAPVYRLFILRDGRVLYYGMPTHGFSMRPSLSCGDPLSVLDYLDEIQPISSFTRSEDMFFVILLKALEKALGVAIADRESKVNNQKALQASLRRAINQIAEK